MKNHKCYMLNVHAYDIYDFKAHDMEFIEKSKAKATHAISFMDNAFDECVKLWCTKNTETEGLLCIISSVTKDHHWIYF